MTAQTETLPSPVDPRTLPDTERFQSLCTALDGVKTRVEAKLGQADARWVHRVNLFSRAMEVVGRVLIHVSFEPILFSLGVFALWIHKQLQAIEIGHTALHGAYDRIEGAERFRAKGFRWDTPIDEES
jgi:NADPH-dependent stearoyl-CoA 9-desaturase